MGYKEKVISKEFIEKLLEIRKQQEEQIKQKKSPKAKTNRKKFKNHRDIVLGNDLNALLFAFANDLFCVLVDVNVFPNYYLNIDKPFRFPGLQLDEKGNVNSSWLWGYYSFQMALKGKLLYHNNGGVSKVVVKSKEYKLMITTRNNKTNQLFYDKLYVFGGRNIQLSDVEYKTNNSYLVCDMFEGRTNQFVETNPFPENPEVKSLCAVTNGYEDLLTVISEIDKEDWLNDKYPHFIPLRTLTKHFKKKFYFLDRIYTKNVQFESSKKRNKDIKFFNMSAKEVIEKQMFIRKRKSVKNEWLLITYKNPKEQKTPK